LLSEIDILIRFPINFFSGSVSILGSNSKGGLIPGI